MKRVIVVDTSSVIRKVAKRILETEGCVVMEAEAGMHLLELCEYEMPDAIIISGSIEDKDFESVIRELRALKDGKKPHVVLSIVEMNVGQIMRARRAGANDYFLKPFDRKVLVAALAPIFDESRATAPATNAA